MYGAVIGAVAGAVVGAMISGRQAQADYKAKRKYANQLKEATEKYKGQNEYNAMLQTGENIGKSLNNMSQGQQLNNGLVQNNNAIPITAINQGVTSNYQQGATLGQSLAKNDYDAKFQNETQEAQNALNMDLTKNNVDRQSAQSAINAVSGAVDLYGKLKGSDEHMKEDLKESDIEDSLRQIKTIQYQYKNPEEDGADNEIHESGITAQSLENTPLFKDAVIEDNGKKKVDMWKLEEALTAGIAQIQKELDELNT